MPSSLTLNLSKPGDVKEKLSLNLKKDEKFMVKLSWDGKTDIDLHALYCQGLDNQQATITALEHICSTYNLRRKIGGQEVGVLDKNPDGTFGIMGGALIHSADALNGDQDGVDEWLTIDPSKITKIPGSYVEIPLVAMIHPQMAGLTFAQVQNAHVHIIDSNGVELLDVNLSGQFGQFVGVQMGAIMIDSAGKAEFAKVGSGFNGDFNSVIEHFG